MKPKRHLWVQGLLFSLCLMANGLVLADVAKGQSSYAARGCIGCHGADGKSLVRGYPSLKGRSASFVRKSLTDFRGGVGENPTMNAMAAGLSDAEINNIADYIGSLK